MTEAQRQIVGEYYYVLCLKLSAHTCHSCKLPGRWVGGRGVQDEWVRYHRGRGRGDVGAMTLNHCTGAILSYYGMLWSHCQNDLAKQE